MSAVKVLFFTAGLIATGAETTAIARLAADPGILLGVRCALFVDNQAPGASGGSAETLEACGGVAGAYPTAGGGFANNYDALISSQAVVDYSAEAVGGPKKLFVLAPAGLAISGTGTKQLSAAAEAPDGTVTDVTTSAAWTSATTSKATVASGTGLVTGVAAGTSVITATLTIGGKSETATATVTVT